MKLNRLGRMISGAALTFALVFGITIASSTTAQAQYRDYNGRYGNQQWSRERVRDYAMKLAYHNAYTEAGRVSDRRSRPNFRNMPGYRNDTNGHLSWMGYENDYREAYRRGYEMGFNESLQGRSRRYDRDDVERVLGADLERTYDNNPYNDRGGRDRDWRDRDGGGRNDIYRMAAQNGRNDGLRAGEEDRNRRRGFDYENDSRYRDAISGYRSEYGNRDQYRQAYREGYRRGYEEGYRQNNRGSRFSWPF
jgi:hypothetical protein